MLINDTIGLVGYSGLVFALIFCMLSLFLAGIQIFGKRAHPSTFFIISNYAQSLSLGIAVLSLGWLLMNNAFEFPLVFDAVEKSMAWYEKFSGLWSGQSSSLLFWSFILSVFIAGFSNMAKRKLSSKFAGIAASMLTIGLVFFLVPVIFISNPFDKLWQLANGTSRQSVFAPPNSSLIVPVDGMGMNPSLRHSAMLLHPPSLYIGMVGFFIPFAFALASMVMNDKSHQWIKLAFPAVIFAWIFLTAGMVLGSWWAYTILGWGGYWGWDAVEIAGLLPWLLSFGLIHSMQMQLRGKDFSNWVYLFSGLIVFFILSGILITRSGILDSVHAYSAGVMGPVLSILILINIGPYFFYFSKHRFYNSGKTRVGQAVISNDLAVLFNYLIFTLVLIYFIGQTFPLTSQMIAGKKISWAPSTYEFVSSPFLLAVLAVTALFPLSDDRKGKIVDNWLLAGFLSILATVIPIYFFVCHRIQLYSAVGFWSASFLVLGWIVHLIKRLQSRNTWVYKVFLMGSVFVHLGLGFIAFGVLGSEILTEKYSIELDVNQEVQISGINFFAVEKKIQERDLGQTIYLMEIGVSKNGDEKIILAPALEFFPKMDLVYAKPAIFTSLKRDIQLILTKWENPDNTKANIQVNIYPLIAWIWIGAGVMIIGGLLILAAGKTDSL